jgi:hypothetical protein
MTDPHGPTSGPGGFKASRPRRDDRLYERLLEQLTEAGLPWGQQGEPVTEAEVEDLPAAARRYLRFMGVIGRPRDWSFRARFIGRFRRRPGAGWMPAEAWQYNSAVEIARVFVMRVRLAQVVPMVARDTYLRGRGRMLGKLGGLVTVVDGTGEEFDHSELVIWLNDAVLLAPSMLLGPAISWTEVDDQCFDVALTDRGPTVTARVFLDERGAPVDFRADRYATLPSGLVLAPWRTPVESWDLVPGRPLPGPALVLYDLPDGPYPYIQGRFVPGSVAYNVPPGRSVAGKRGS